MKGKYIINGKYEEDSFFVTIKKINKKTFLQKIFPCIFKSEN